MAIFEWQPAYATGIPKIDQQHKRLVAMINELDDAVHNHASPDHMRAIFEDLFEYTRYHFQMEESLMEEFTYDTACTERHKAQHQRFVNELTSVAESASFATKADGQIILAFLTNWLINHICKVDRKLADHLIDHAHVDFLEKSLNEETTPTDHGQTADHQIVDQVIEFDAQFGATVQDLMDSLNQILDDLTPPETEVKSRIQNVNSQLKALDNAINSLSASAKSLKGKSTPET
ncbi:hemerythrin HHE cation binding protein [Oleiphilus messinensis]|uniref:Hemerythrin HHE cation binding protein n=1 Tax=Oleiphilus messinensis TaxID=141451 RepID=A0A1Y0I1B2_9GAMM|nr:bacteriohemerythrin [Oleiphilus messinensis]ARU54191.1 hemerythrin HHE cation binding protein [Oleiphilus messinensis]